MLKKRAFKNNYITNIDQAYRENMPFYVETTGVQCIKKGQIEKKSAIQSRRIALGWGIRGAGKVNIGGAEAVVEKNGIFLSYPVHLYHLFPCDNLYLQSWIYLLLQFHYFQIYLILLYIGKYLL